MTGLNKSACQVLVFVSMLVARPQCFECASSKGGVRQTQEVNERETGVFFDEETLGLFRDVICGVNILPVCPVIMST